MFRMYDYKCPGCSLKKELMLKTEEQADAKPECPRCGEIMQSMLAAPALKRSTMDDPNIDLVVGSSADKGREVLADRQATRDKVRKETGAVGLQQVAPGEYRPIPEAAKQTRTDLHEALASAGEPSEATE